MFDPFTTLLAIDFDRNAAATYAENFPGVDVRCAKVEDCLADLPNADIIIGGPPCQGFSLAGEGKGEHDERDGWPAAIAAVEKKRPRMFLFENVAGMLTARHIGYFSRVYAQFEKLGYRVEWRLLDSVNYGVPQFRERVWVWGIREDVKAQHCWPAPTHAWPPPTDGLFGGHGLLPAVTVGEALGIGCDVRDVRDVRVATGQKKKFSEGPNERANCPAFTLDQKQYHGVITPAYDHGLAEPSEPCPTIKAGGNVDASGHQGGACPPAIPYRWSDAMLAKHPPASPASTVQAKFCKGGAEGLLQITDNPKHQPHQPHQPANTLGSGGNGHGMSAANMTVRLCKDGRTWEELHPPASPASPAPTVRARSPRDGGRCTESVIKDGLTVRRLTPLECARLMSMPDDFRWPAKITKTTMYKIIGNGQCSLMTHHLAWAMHRADPEAVTMISLFCGGGVGDSGIHGRFWRYKE